MSNSHSGLQVSLDPFLHTSHTSVSLLSSVSPPLSPSDANLEDEILPFLASTSFPDLNWYPSARSVFWRKDNLVAAATPGNGSYTLPLFPARLQYVWELLAGMGEWH